MKRFKNFSKRTSALLIAAVLLLAAGTVTGVRAAFIAQSDLYRAEFYVNHLQVFLLENGAYACDLNSDKKPDNTVNGTKVTGTLATKLGYKKTADGTETLGTVDPGRAYEEVIQARNGQDVPEYVRLTVRKYWLKEKKDEDGNTVMQNGKPVMIKATELSPSLIKFSYKGKAYNDDAWSLGESSTESATYYYTTPLDRNADTAPLFDTLTIDKSVAPDMHMPTDAELKSEEYADYVTVTETETGAKVYTYSYKYDGYTFYVEADVQALQTHNAQDAIHSAWGVYNVEVQPDGSLQVK